MQCILLCVLSLSGTGRRVVKNTTTMTTVRYPDAAGNTLTLMDYGGETCVNWIFSEQSVRDSHRLPVREDDIFMCSYPKCGAHWLWEMVRMLLEGTTDTQYFDKEDMMMENLTQEKAAALPSPRVLSTHYYFHEIPEDIQKYKNKIIFVHRNPKDVAVSFYYMHKLLPAFEYNGEFNDYLELFFTGKVDWGSYFTYLQKWDKVIRERPDHPIHVVAYESLKKNPVEELRRLSKFLEKERDDDFLEKVHEICNIDVMREKKKAQSPFGENHIKCMFRKGIIGDWKNYFSVARNEQMDQLIKEQLADVQMDIQWE